MSKNENITADSNTIAEHRFTTNDGLHKIYVQEWGNAKGVPILFVHGGPGNGCNDGHKKYFDSTKHRVIFLDQRGSGKSTPYGSLRENNTQKLVEDIETVRQKLKIDNWHIKGSSWGSTLALAYGIKHPERVKSMVIMGVFLGTQEEIDWLENGLYKTFYPEVFDNARVGKFDYKRKSDQRAYLELFLPLMALDDRPKTLPEDKDLDLNPIKIELYYLGNKCFLPNDYILNNAHKVTAPVTIIQGRYDMITPPISAYRLSKALPDCTMHTTLSGHIGGEQRESYTALKTYIGTLT